MLSPAQGHRDQGHQDQGQDQDQDQDQDQHQQCPTLPEVIVIKLEEC